MKYGLPYKGSKNKLATKIVAILPQRKHLYDLFCGGCAVTHAAMMGRKFENFHINDINWMCPQLFKDVLEGKYDNENRWISREEFFRLKDTDPYVAFVWSFGNNLRDYIYGKDIEPLKKAIHYAMFYADYSLAKDLGHDLSFIDGIEDMQTRYLSIKHYFEGIGGGQIQLEHYNRLVRLRGWRHTNDTNVTGGGRNDSNPTKQPHYYKRPAEMQNLECRNQCIEISKKKITSNGNSRAICRDWASAIPRTSPQSATRGGQDRLITSHGDYQDVPILPDSVIYCDIPYRDTNVYDKDNSFDYDRFYDWAYRQTEPIFISEYWMPEDRFTCIQEFTHRSTLSATANNAVCEKLWIPKEQKVTGQVQLVFDFGGQS